MRKIVMALGVVIGLFLVFRALAELFVIDVSDPATYRDDWGGPSLAGVLIVHCGPGILAAVLLVRALVRRRSVTGAESLRGGHTPVIGTRGRKRPSSP